VKRMGLFGWVAVLLGAIIMKLFDLPFIDPLISIILSIVIFLASVKELKEIFQFFLLKCPIPYEKIEDALKNYATHPLHVKVADEKVRPFTKTRSCLDFED